MRETHALSTTTYKLKTSAQVDPNSQVINNRANTSREHAEFLPRQTQDLCCRISEEIALPANTNTCRNLNINSKTKCTRVADDVMV